MPWKRALLAAALSSVTMSSVAQAQVNVQYSTFGGFWGLCSGLVCTRDGMTVKFNPLTDNTIVLDAWNNYSSNLSFGSFTVTGNAPTPASFLGVGFDLIFTQSLPAPGSPPHTSGSFSGSIDFNGSNLLWNPAPTTFMLSAGGAGSISYLIDGPVDLEPPSSNGGFTSIQGHATVVPEPSTYALMASGLAGLLLLARTRRRA